MNNPLTTFYTPNATPGESPVSIILRSTGRHFERPGTVLKKADLMRGEFAPVARKAIAGDKTLIDAIADAADWSQLPGIRTLAQRRSHKRWINPKVSTICPSCAIEGMLPAIHDLNPVDTCTKHGLKLRSHCYACESALSWSRPKLDSCSCYTPIHIAEVATETDIAYAKLIEELIYSEKLVELEQLEDLRKVTDERFFLGNSSKALAIDIFTGEMQLLPRLLGYLKTEYPHIPSALWVSPFAKWVSPTVSPSLTESALPSDLQNLAVTNFQVTGDELIRVLQCKPNTAHEVMNTVHSWMRIKHPVRERYEFDAIHILFEVLAPQPPQTDQSMTLRELACHSKKPIAYWMRRILAGTHRVIDNPTGRISDAVVDHAIAPNDDVPEGYFTIDQATQYLELYELAITQLRNHGLVNFSAQPHRNNRFLYEQASLDSYLSTYITGGELAKRWGVESRTLSEKLLDLGVEPICEPDSASAIYVFRQSDVAHLKPHDLANVSAHYSRSGRQAGNGQHPDAKKWLTATKTSETLGISVQQLSTFVGLGTLNAGRPPNAGAVRTRYFTSESVVTTKAFIDSMVSVDLLSKLVGSTRRKVVRRLTRRYKYSLITVNGHQYVTPEVAEGFQHHCEQLWTATDIAAFMHCTRYDVNNWVRLGHLTPIDENHPDYLGTMNLFLRKSIEEFASTHPLARKAAS